MSLTDDQTGARRAPRTFLHIQYLRWVAAVLVVYFQNKIYVPQFAWTIDRSFGYGGVDIFFVVSGLMMTLNNDDRAQTPARFLLKQCQRIYPPYSLALTAAILLFTLAPAAFIKDQIDKRYVLASYLLLPIESGLRQFSAPASAFGHAALCSRRRFRVESCLPANGGLSRRAVA